MADSHQKSPEPAADIFESSLTLESSHCDEGYADGYRDGVVSGKRDGHEVGLKNGFEMGEELGFYQGLVDVWLSAIRVDPSCFSTRVQKSIHQMSQLLQNYPVQDPESDSVDEMKASLRLKLRAVSATLGVKLEYDGYPKTSSIGLVWAIVIDPDQEGYALAENAPQDPTHLEKY
ncbi:hypothetical protein V2J09_017243 [Rumex salicifolius]